MDMSPVDLLNPFEILPTQRAALPMAVGGGVVGGALGFGMFRRGLKGAAIGAVAGTALSLDASDRRTLRMAMQPEMINRHLLNQRQPEGPYGNKQFPIQYMDQRYRNRMPLVNGNMVIGMYNSRGA
jgi:hypothetical protein